MAIRIPIITDLEDRGIKQAKIAFGNFKTAVSNAEGGLGKFKAGSKSIFDSVAANAGVFAVAGGIAFAKIAAAGIKAFQHLALESGKFADATGLAVEQASRWIEVAGDIGIESSTVETAFGKMNKTLGNSPKLFNDLGVEVVKTKDGATDANATFLNVVERLKGIKDPAEKAKVATQLLGKGWQSMAELINMGSTSLKASLAGVSNAKVIDPAELQRAKDYRASQDRLKDSFEELSISIGQTLVPSLTVLANAIAYVTEHLDFQVGNAKSSQGALDQLGQIWDNWFGSSDKAAEGIDTATTAMTDQEKVAKLNAAATLASNMATAKLRAEMERLAAPLQMVNYQWQTLTNQLSTTVAIDTAKQQIKDLGDAAVKAFGSGTQADIAAYHQELLTATNTIQELAGGLDIVSNRAIKILVDNGELEQAVALIDLINGNNVLIGKAAATANKAGRGLYIPARASGGPVMGGKSYLVGERGPELFTPGTSGGITPNGAIGNNTINITVTSADPNAVVRALQSYNRNVGKIPVSVQ
jgi:hypothetical protein